MNKDEEFRNRIQTKKGDIGQKIFRYHMSEKRPHLKLYPHGQQNVGGHMFDGLIMDGRKLICLYDVKTKPRRYKYEDTGIDYKDFKSYIDSSEKYNVPFVVVFVDQYTRQIYYSKLSSLVRKIKINKIQYPYVQPTKKGDNIIYFPLKFMKVLDELTYEEKQLIQSKQTMDDSYKRFYDGNLRTVCQILKDENDGYLF